MFDFRVNIFMQSLVSEDNILSDLWENIFVYVFLEIV